MSLATRTIVQAVYELASADDRIVGSTGLISRHLHDFARNDARCFYMIGSMGLALPLAVGIATAAPRGRTIVLDGDGAILMGAASLVLAGDLRPLPLHHVVIANAQYASTGGQLLPGRAADLVLFAKAAGYVHAERIADAGALQSSAASLWQGQGPTMLVVDANDVAQKMPPRVIPTAEEIATAFRERARAGGDA